VQGHPDCPICIKRIEGTDSDVYYCIHEQLLLFPKDKNAIYIQPPLKQEVILAVSDHVGPLRMKVSHVSSAPRNRLLLHVNNTLITIAADRWARPLRSYLGSHKNPQPFAMREFSCLCRYGWEEWHKRPQLPYRSIAYLCVCGEKPVLATELREEIPVPLEQSNEIMEYMATHNRRLFHLRGSLQIKHLDSGRMIFFYAMSVCTREDDGRGHQSVVKIAHVPMNANQLHDMYIDNSG
jgi:hypothetical protein